VLERAPAVTVAGCAPACAAEALRASDRPQRIFDAVRQVVAETGALKGKTRRALDSTLLYDAVATQDTVTLLVSMLRRVRARDPRGWRSRCDRA
jgi:hypothetical protein